MNAIGDCLKYVFCCGCCKPKKKTLVHHRSAARMEETIRNVAETSISKSLVVEVKTHHILKSTDMVTASQFFKQEKEMRDESSH